MSDPFILHNRIGFKVTRLARIMEVRLEQGLKPHNVTRLMWCVLRGVGMEGQQTPSELADYISIAKPAVSRLLKEMEARGLIERRSTQGDGRGIHVYLTALGQEKLGVCAAIVEALNAHFSSKLAPYDYEAFMRMADALTYGEDVTLIRL